MTRLVTSRAAFADLALKTPLRIGDQWCSKIDLGTVVAWPLSPNHPHGEPDHGRSAVPLPKDGFVEVIA